MGRFRFETLWNIAVGASHMAKEVIQRVDRVTVAVDPNKVSFKVGGTVPLGRRDKGETWVFDPESLRTPEKPIVEEYQGAKITHFPGEHIPEGKVVDAA